MFFFCHVYIFIPCYTQEFVIRTNVCGGALVIWFWDPDLYCTVTPVIQYQCTNGLDAWTRACRAYCPRVPTHRSRCIYGQISSTLPIEGQDQPCLFQLKTKSLGDTPNYTRNHPKCFFLGGLGNCIWHHLCNLCDERPA